MKKFETIKDELEYITKVHKGLIKPKDVVSFAENPTTKLHTRFEWDDSIAGYNYRLWQARQIISLELHIVPREMTEHLDIDLTVTDRSTRAFISLPFDRYNAYGEGGGYRKVEDIMKDPSLRERLLDAAKEEMLRFKEKYQMLKELTEIFEAIEKLTKVEAE